MDKKIHFNYGKTIEISEMKPNTIYLDGACRGPFIDTKNKSYSFDHHDDCVRMATLATTQQVATALTLGLNPKDFDVVINDLDADTTFSLWMLKNPHLVNDKVIEQANAIGFVDANGPVKEPTKLHKVLSHNPREPQTQQMLEEDLKHISTWFEKGNDFLPEPFEYEKVDAIGIDAKGMLKRKRKVSDFSELYDDGIVAGILLSEGPNNTIGYTIAKRSDFVDYDIPQFLEKMNELEPGWGGGSTIGGAPRKDGGERSSLSIEKVTQEFMKISTLGKRKTKKYENNEFSM